MSVEALSRSPAPTLSIPTGLTSSRDRKSSCSLPPTNFNRWMSTKRQLPSITYSTRTSQTASIRPAAIILHLRSVTEKSIRSKLQGVWKENIFPRRWSTNKKKNITFRDLTGVNRIPGKLIRQNDYGRTQRTHCTRRIYDNILQQTTV